MQACVQYTVAAPTLWFVSRSTKSHVILKKNTALYARKTKGWWLYSEMAAIKIVDYLRAGALVQWLKLPAWKNGIAGSSPTLAVRFQRNKMFLPRWLVKIQYCGEPPWPRGSLLGLRPPGLKFRILCLESSVFSFISPSSAGYPAKFSLYVHKGGLKSHLFHFICRLFVNAISKNL